MLYFKVSFYISGQPVFQGQTEAVGSNATTYTIINLLPFTTYVVSLTGRTFAEGMRSSDVQMRTGFGGETREGDYSFNSLLAKIN